MTDRRYPRMARVNEVVREVVADELEALDDPRLGFVTVTGVEVTPDLKHAKVFYSSLPVAAVEETLEETPDVSDDTQEEAPDTAKALESVRRQLQDALGRQVRLKYVPRLVFVEDPAMAAGERIESIIRELHEDEP